MPSVTVPAGSESRQSRQKGVLFCPSCWHESPVDGDWQVRTTRSGRRLDCPVCGEPVAERPRADGGRTSDRGVGALARFVAYQLTWVPRLASRQLSRLRRRELTSEGRAAHDDCHPGCRS